MPAAKYTDNAKIKIVAMKNPYLDAKYPDVEQFASQRGKVIHSHYVGESSPNDTGVGKKQAPSMYYIYIVQLDKDKTFVTVPEVALTITK